MKGIFIFSPKTIQHLFLSVFLEFGPVIFFLISFEFFHVYKATLILIIATILSTFFTYKVQKRLPYLALYVALLTSIFGYITLTLHEPKFIQIRDTLYDATFAVTLIVGVVVNKLFLKIAFNKVIPMTDKAWKHISYSWIIFFITLSSLNEYVRRTMSLSTWFDFKSLSVILTLLFGCITLYVFYEEEKEIDVEK